ncbi:hypothetical protein EUGRSUZ_E00257 [Eucalyptus grandis]|uniref:Uncharacterized protein n=2 Tax=Eucalyptus grandis TaxID=71139 RepID=A0ACC3KQS6_EUCGR|nr:hypothetical protein EUGRSUZ_E00257 [Eucalyptus grandis]
MVVKAEDGPEARIAHEENTTHGHDDKQALGVQLERKFPNGTDVQSPQKVAAAMRSWVISVASFYEFLSTSFSKPA